MQNRQKQNWIVGAMLFGGFFLTLWLDLTGVRVHQWLGVALAALAVVHLTVHWRWVVAVTGRFFGRTSRQARVYYVVDAGLALGFVAILASGLVISTWLSLAEASFAAWRAIHVVASVATLALVVAKIGLHWRWIITTARRFVFPVPTQGVPVEKPQATRVPVPTGRRDFLRLMAGVGAVAVLGGANALSSLVQTPTGSAAQAASDANAGALPLSSTSASSCTVACQRRCSYPGHCGRYTDSNGNGRCDHGECAS
jgi:hypothetical protein